MFNNGDMFHPPKGEDDAHAYHTPLEQKFNAVLTPLHEYANTQVIASLFLFLCTLCALIWASLPGYTASYEHFVHMPIGLKVSNYLIENSLRYWVNDLLLVLFFFFVGLEIKRELLAGELTNRKRAVLTIFAAIGGMALPALIYFTMNYGTASKLGWGIPMATDTAFALGILYCFKQKLPKGIFTFLAALAIIDDIGAITVIAIFYTDNFNLNMLLLTLLLCLILTVFNYAGFRKPMPYIIIGVIIWWALENTGVHGTVAGIIVAFLIPARPQKGPKYFIDRTKSLLNLFEDRKNESLLILEDDQQHELLEEVQEIAEQATTPLQRWERKLERPISLLVLPLFALVNAGIPVNMNLLGHVLMEPVGLGILLGLVIGKPFGVLFFSYMALKLNLGMLPKNITFRHLVAIAALTGIGFTMSIFISNIGFETQPSLLLTAKAAILLSSIVSGCLGIFMLLMLPKKDK